ncbi:hypothetical protein [Rhodococcus sp. IEGM 1379]|uniref:hypothetical protein n=1 Tax=Rhodococcus sp. IEGM 1379 TaxID=3047086 RepID=UPI0024B8702B|nr:hypothetical protein [Rhodococcus sp. IEGM 1379]MDI9918270.1 hypothetical protein [Rhodococcus sp. IEGM 1379]
MAERWHESRRLERWMQTVALATLLVLGPSTVNAVISEHTTWNWVRLSAWILATVGFAIATVQSWKNRNKPRSSRLTSTVDPSEIPIEDVRKAIASTDSRIPAVKALREQHTGLGLKDAAELIDAELGK